MKIHLFAVALLANSCVHAQESRGETQAIRCAALSFIHTSLSKSDPEFGTLMTSSTIVYGTVFAARQAARTGSMATNGEVNSRRELVLEEFKKSWKTNPELVVREAALCNAWRAEFAPRLGVLNARSSETELMRLVGEPPTGAAGDEVNDWRVLVPLAFAAWAELDYATPATVRKKMEQSLGKTRP